MWCVHRYWWLIRINSCVRCLKKKVKVLHPKHRQTFDWFIVCHLCYLSAVQRKDNCTVKVNSFLILKALVGCADTANKHVASFKCAGCNWIWLQTFVSHLQLLQHNVHHMTFPWGLMAVDEDGRVTVLLGLKKGEYITLFKDLSNHINIYCIFNICIFMNI